MGQPSRKADISLGGAAEETAAEVDPQAQRKIESVRARFLEELMRVRPRISTSLQGMTVSGNTIRATVTTDLICREIMDNRREILGVLSSLTDIRGTVEFDITVTPPDPRTHPVTLEERYAFLLRRNPALENMRRRLDMEPE